MGRHNVNNNNQRYYRIIHAGHKSKSVQPVISHSSWSIETLGEAILNLSGQIDLPITLETSHYLVNIGNYNHRNIITEKIKQELKGIH